MFKYALIRRSHDMMTSRALALLLLTAPCVHADDWPQWLGPQRDGVWRETGILEKFPANGPKIRWRTPIGGGYSGPAVANGKVYLMDRKLATGANNPKNAFDQHAFSGTERVLCLNEADGKILWQHEYDCPYQISYAGGPRVTPTVSDGKVYAVGAMGNLFCLDADKGKVIWSHDFQKEYHAHIPVWGSAAHPLLDGDKLFCIVGGADSIAVAFNKNTGKEIWRALSAREPGYCPPTMINAGLTKQLIIWHPQSVNALDPQTGKVWWSYPWEVRSGLSIATPRQAGDLLLFSSFYTSSKCFRLNGTEPTAMLAWEGKSFSERNTDTLHSLMSTPFIEGGYIYGVCSYGQLRCLKLSTGERVWESLEATGSTGDLRKPTNRWANAFIIKNGIRFFLANEHGDLIIAKLSPSGYEEISRTHLLEATSPDPGRNVVWSHPAFANQCVYARNDKEIVCASLAAEK